jgi:hypothetical protein
MIPVRALKMQDHHQGKRVLDLVSRLLFWSAMMMMTTTSLLVHIPQALHAHLHHLIQACSTLYLKLHGARPVFHGV